MTQRKIVEPDENKFPLKDALFTAYETSFIHFRQASRPAKRFSLRRFFHNLHGLMSRLFNIKSRVTFRLSGRARREVSTHGSKPFVLHVICNMEIGGSQKIILDLFEHMTTSYRMKILTGRVPFYVHYRDIPITVLNAKEDIEALLKVERPDIVHFHYWGLDAWMQMFLETAYALKEQVGYRIVENSNNPILVVYDPLIDHYVHVSEFVLSLQDQVVPKSIQSVNHPGVDEKIFAFRSQRDDPMTAGMVYRLTNDKISADTIDLLISVCRSAPELIIYVIGDGPNLRHFIERAYQESVRDNIFFTGFVAYEKLSQYYERFNIFLAPVHHESYGVVVPYAMFKGNPVVAYDVDVIGELLPHGNLVVKTPEQFINCVVRVLDGSLDVSDLIRLNRRSAEERFTLCGMIAQYDRLYTELLK